MWELLFSRVTKIQKYVQKGPDIRTDDHLSVEHSDRESLVLDRCNHGWLFRRYNPEYNHSPTTWRSEVGLGECERFSAYGAGDIDERAGSASGFHAPPIYVQAMDEEPCLFFVIYSSFVFCRICEMNSPSRILYPSSVK